MKNKRIKTKPDIDMDATLKMGGWFSGKKTYLWFGKFSNSNMLPEDEFLGTLSGQKLYRLAKAIVNQFETDWETK